MIQQFPQTITNSPEINVRCREELKGHGRARNQLCREFHQDGVEGKKSRQERDFQKKESHFPDDGGGKDEHR